jgi:hypothetical protein
MKKHAVLVGGKSQEFASGRKRSRGSEVQFSKTKLQGVRGITDRDRWSTPGVSRDTAGLEVLSAEDPWGPSCDIQFLSSGFGF